MSRCPSRDTGMAVSSLAQNKIQTLTMIINDLHSRAATSATKLCIHICLGGFSPVFGPLYSRCGFSYWAAGQSHLLHPRCGDCAPKWEDLSWSWKIRSKRSRMERGKNDKGALDLVFTEHLCENNNKASTSTNRLMLPFLKHFSNQQTSAAELPKCVESIQKCDGWQLACRLMCFV